MRITALAFCLGAALFVSCSSHRKDAKTEALNYDTVKTDSGVSIIKTKDGKVISTVPTASLSHGGTTVPGNTSTATTPESSVKAVAPAQEYPYYVEGVLIHGEGGNITLDQLGIGNDIKPLAVQAANSEGRF